MQNQQNEVELENKQELLQVNIDEDEEQKNNQLDDQKRESTIFVESQYIESFVDYQQNKELQDSHKMTKKIRNFQLETQVIESQLRYDEVKYKLTSRIDGEDEYDVQRKYTHFEWLQKALKQEFPGIIVPSIPERTFNAKMNLGQVTQEVREERLYGLRAFLNKILRHSQFCTSKETECFFTANQQEIDYKMQQFDELLPYSQQIGKKLTSFFSGSVSYFSSKQSSQQNDELKRMDAYSIDHIVNKNFEEYNNALFQQEKKTQKIYEVQYSIIQNKVKQLSNQNEFIKYQQTLFEQKPSYHQLNKIIGQQYIQQNEIYIKNKKEILFPLKVNLLILDFKQYYLDFQQAQILLKEYFELGTTINYNITKYNENIQSEQGSQLKNLIDAQKEKHQKIKENFTKDILSFSQRINDEISQIIDQYQKGQEELNQKNKKLWA